MNPMNPARTKRKESKWTGTQNQPPGFTLVEVLVSSAILALSLLLVAPMVVGRKTRIADSSARLSATLIRGNMTQLLLNTQVWNQLLNDPVCGADMGCILNQNCTAMAGAKHPISCLKDLQGNVLSSNSDPAVGFGFDQSTCHSFIPGGVSAACPFSYSLTWEVKCPPLPGNCLNAPIQIEGIFQTSVAAGTLSSTQAYDFRVRH